MLMVNKIQTNPTFSSNKFYEQRLNSFGNNFDAKQAYLDMNSSVYNSYIDGDISLPKYLRNKLKNFWNIVLNKDPLLELKARIIEESLKESAKEKLHLNRLV